MAGPHGTLDYHAITIKKPGIKDSMERGPVRPDLSQLSPEKTSRRTSQSTPWIMRNFKKKCHFQPLSLESGFLPARDNWGRHNRSSCCRGLCLVTFLFQTAFIPGLPGPSWVSILGFFEMSIFHIGSCSHTATVHYVKAVVKPQHSKSWVKMWVSLGEGYCGSVSPLHSHAWNGVCHIVRDIHK